MQAKTKILFLCANPKDSSRLDLDEEIRLIEQQINTSNYRNNFEFIPKLAVRSNEFVAALITEKPNIVHFSGHGTKTGIVLIDDYKNDDSRIIDERTLMNVFSILKDHLKCVVLNACYTVQQAIAISQVVPCVVGIDREIEDRIAREFSVGFYMGICNGYDVAESFRIGRTLIEFNKSVEADNFYLQYAEGVELIDLKFVNIQGTNSENHKPANEAMVVVIVYVDKHSSEFSPEDEGRLYEAVRSILGYADKKGRKDGSVYLYIEIPESRADEFIELVNSGQLAEYGATYAELTSAVGADMVSERVFYFLPEFTAFGLLRIIEEFELSDGSEITVCQNPTGQLYFARLDTLETLEDVWYLIAISKQKYDYVRSGSIELREVFLAPENGNFFRIRISSDTDEEILVESLPPGSLSESILPVLNEYIQLKTHTLPPIPDTALSRATNTNREFFNLRFEFRNVFRTEAPVKLLGNILTSFQETIDVLADSLRTDAKAFGKIPDIVQSQTQMMVTNIGASSFHIEMASENVQIAIDEDSPISLAIRKLVTLLRKGVSNSDLRSELISMPSRSISKYQELLRRFGDEHIEITGIEWASPRDQKFEVLSFTQEQAAEMVRNIKRIDELYTRTIFSRGKLVGVNIRRRTFEFQYGKETKDVYAGDIVEEWDAKFDFDKSYVAHIRQTRYLNRPPKYVLVRLYDIGFMGWLFGEGENA